MQKIIKDIVVVIPAYCPNQELQKSVKEMANTFQRILVVNDGSSKEYDDLFFSLKKHVEIIKHPENEGKGAAIKTALNFLKDDESVLGIITVDADGQHLTQDVINIADHASGRSDNFILGVRDFSENIPLRSKFGNVLTLFILKLFYGLSLGDSQTGLRYVPRRLFESLIALPGERYEFELQCLLSLNRNKEVMVQVPIDTVYIEDNESSHFRPLHDSIRIYSVFFRFGFSSIFCFALDILVFSTVLAVSSGNIMASTAVARVVSGASNFWLNRVYVFGRSNEENWLRHGFLYLMLWLFLMLTSALIVGVIDAWLIGTYIVAIKIITDSILFFLSYNIQKSIIFKKEK